MKQYDVIIHFSMPQIGRSVFSLAYVDPLFLSPLLKSKTIIYEIGGPWYHPVDITPVCFCLCRWSTLVIKLVSLLYVIRGPMHAAVCLLTKDETQNTQLAEKNYSTRCFDKMNNSSSRNKFVSTIGRLIRCLFWRVIKVTAFCNANSNSPSNNRERYDLKLSNHVL